MRLQRLGILFRLSWQLTRLRFSGASDRQHQSRRLLFDNFTYLGGVYIKFLQLLALSVDFLKGWAGPAEFEIFESVAYEPIDLPALLAAEIPDYKQQFRAIDTTPFAAGSFAQVYKAELTDGTVVVLKVLRPSLVRHLKSDLRLLGLVARFSAWLYPTSLVDARQLYKQFATTVRGETDYRREVRNAQWFYDYFARTPEIVVPRTFADLSGKHIIVQEYVDGISLAEVLTLRQQGYEPAAYVQSKLASNLWQQLETIGSELLIATVTADFVLGDPHPGNIKLLPDNRVGLIDFGIAAAAPHNRQAFLQLIREYQKLYDEAFDASSFTLAALTFFDEDLVAALQMAGRLYAPEHPSSLLDHIGTSARSALAEQLGNSQTQNLMRRRMMMQVFDQAINQQNRFGLTMNMESAMMFKSAITYLKMVASLATDGENFPVIRRAIHRTVAVAEASNMPLDTRKQSLSLEQSLELLSNWLARVADKDPFLYEQIAASMGV